MIKAKDFITLIKQLNPITLSLLKLQDNEITSHLDHYLKNK